MKNSLNQIKKKNILNRKEKKIYMHKRSTQCCGAKIVTELTNEYK